MSDFNMQVKVENKTWKVDVSMLKFYVSLCECSLELAKGLIEFIVPNVTSVLCNWNADISAIK